MSFRLSATATLLLIALALGACGNAVANPSPPETVVAVNPPNEAIRTAATLYLSREAGLRTSYRQVEVERIEGDAARARVYPEDPNATDPAWLFLRKESGLWTVVAGPGTAFSPADLQDAGIPESLAPSTP
jgi:hypothetical protein